jgi:arylsulfatase
MEVYAGFVEHADYNAGRVIDEIEQEGKLNNTLIFYIWGDNGASAEGQNGTISELLAQNGIPTTIQQHIKTVNELGGLDVIGTSKTDNMYHAGWAWAGGTPYKSTKLVAAHFGGTRQPMAVSWPAKIKHDGTPRPQFHHVTDIVPTIYEAVGITPPRVVNGVDQMSIDGRKHGLYVCRRDSEGTQDDAVFRHHGEPRHLSGRLVCRHPRSAHSVGAGTTQGHRDVEP